MKKTLEEARTELKALRESYRRLFATLDGQAVLEDLKQRVEQGKSLRPSEGQPLDPSQAVWNEGTRFPIRWITSMLRGDEDV